MDIANRKNKVLILRILLLGMITFCLVIFISCSGSPNDKYLNKKYEKNELEAITYREGLTVSGTIDQIAADFTGKKGETYMFSLGFHPTTDNIAEFEQILRNDFAGEIEIFQNGKPHSIINYNDFETFAWSPGRDAYGPVYYLIIDYPGYTLRYSFKLKIRAKKTCTYSFYLQRVRKSFSGYIAGFFKSKTNDGRKQYIAQNPKHEDDKINVPAVLRRIDMEMEKKGRHHLIFGFHFPSLTTVDGKREYAKEMFLFDNIMKKDYDGVIKIYKNGNPYLMMQFDNVASGSGGFHGLWGGHYGEAVHAKVYSFYVDKPGIYSFIPEMKSFEEFEFSLSIYRNIWRK